MVRASHRVVYGGHFSVREKDRSAAVRRAAGRIAVLLLLGCLGMLLRAPRNATRLLATGYAIALYGLTRIHSEAAKGGITLTQGVR